MSDAFRGAGYNVTSADINQERPDFIFADMSKKLPFENNSFDIVVCLEGIEHLIDPVDFIKEVSRVCKDGGKVFISTPNITNMYSRLQYLFTGTFFQFSPMDMTKIKREELADRGHITPLTYWQLRYLFKCYDFSLKNLYGDKIKRKIFLPIYLPIIILGRYWLHSIFHQNKNSLFNEQRDELIKHSYSRALLFSRSIILEFRKY